LVLFFKKEQTFATNLCAGKDRAKIAPVAGIAGVLGDK
jgi:hypothetical protein